MDIWDIVQQVQIENLKARQGSSELEVELAVSRSRHVVGAQVNSRVDHLTLVTEAMWELISERMGITIAELAARVRDIDARDGHIDGRHGPVADAPAIHCQSCQAVVPAGKTVCQFCGADVPAAKADPFRL